MEEGQQSGKNLSAVFRVLPPTDAPVPTAQLWGVPGQLLGPLLLLVCSTASMALAAEVQSRARVSEALPVPHHCWPAQSTSQTRHAERAQERHCGQRTTGFSNAFHGWLCDR